MDLDAFLNKIVFGSIKHDLTQMQVGNFPLALCVLAYMEYLGGFLLGQSHGFAENVSEYIVTCFERPKEYPIDILRDIFRNGLAHEYFARGAISCDGGRPAIYYDPTIGAILDVKTLVHDFLDSLPSFKTKLSITNYQLRMNSAVEKIAEMRQRHRLLIAHLPTRKDHVESNNVHHQYSIPSISFGPIIK